MADDQPRSDEEQDEGQAEEEEQDEGQTEEEEDGASQQEGDGRSDGGGRSDGDDSDTDDEESDERTPSPSLSAKEMTMAAKEALGELTGHEPEAATGLQWDGESWLVTVDVLELRRIPDTTDLLATYVVQLDDDGNLSGYKRTRRFQRSQAEEA